MKRASMSDEGKRLVWAAIGFIALGFWALMAQGCAAPAAGQKCKVGDAYCQGPASCLACNGGALAVFQCPGPKGCARDKDRNVLCDQSTGAMPGTPCFPEYERTGHCAPGGTAVLACLSGRWTQTACPTGQLCRARGSTVSCE